MGNKGKEDRHRSSYIPFRCSQELELSINKIAAERRITKSDVLRELVNKGLVASGYKQDEDALYELVKGAVKETFTPQVERLATIGAKATQISSAAYFLLVYVARMYFPEGDRELVDEVAAQARQLGIEFLKLRQGVDVDEFIKGSIRKIVENDAASNF